MADTLPRIDHIIIGALDIRVAAKHFLDTYGLGGARILCVILIEPQLLI